MERSPLDRRLAAFLGLWLVYVLNDFLFMRIHTYALWLITDYTIRGATVLAFLVLAARSILSARDAGLSPLSWRRFLAWSAGLSVLGILVDQVAWRAFEKLLPSASLSSFPAADNPALEVVDLTLGIALVAVTEEVIFRGYFLSVFGERIRGRALLVLLSAFFFGTIHWSQGLHAVLATALWGIPPLLCARSTRSILPAIVAHFATDFVSFSGVLPGRWFGGI